MADSLDVFEKRLETLENRVFGGSNKDAHYPRMSDPSQCTDVLASAQGSLGKAVAGKKKINKIYDRLQDLQECLDPGKADEMTLSNDAKAEIILAGVGELSSRLQELSRIQVAQQDEAGQLSEETLQLLATYNNIINLLSKQFVKWDETLTKMEQVKFTKKPLD
ncbi:DCTN3-like protein [Mya arenaria]|uniref:DCTN3-like protein n=1 Tax=Mya arenaria TaxID=6604 RepID=A0ABY7DLQ4_MYAAR|nr:DCTN3-like protein [Mya arenaria]